MHQAASAVDTHGNRITSRDLRQAQRISISASCLGMFWISLTFAMPMTMFMEAIGATGVLIGAMTTMRLLAMVMQIPGAIVSENLGSRKKFWAPLVIVHRAMWLGAAVLAVIWRPEYAWLPLAMVAIVAASDALGNLAAASWFSWMADLIPPKTTGRFWGIRQTFVTAAGIAGLGLAGFILDLFREPAGAHPRTIGFAIVFALGGILGIADVLVHLWVKEPMPAEPDRHRSIFARVLAPLRNVPFRQLTIAFGAWNFAVAMVGAFGIVYLKRDFHVSYLEIASLSIAGSVGAMATGYSFGHLIDRIGARVLGGVLLMLAPLTHLAWFFISEGEISIAGVQISRPMLFVLPTTFLSGAIFSGIALCQFRLAPALSSAAGRTVSMAMHWSVVGLVAALGPFLGGAIMDFFVHHPIAWKLPSGMPVSFLHVLLAIFALVAWGIALPLLLRIQSPSAEVPLTSAISRLFLVNPLNAVRNLYNMHVVSAHTSSRQRASAAKSLGMFRSGLAVTDLIDRLDDPSLDVQEHAIEALQEIDAPEAIEALLRKLADPGCELAPQVCRALRGKGDVRCVEPLLRLLGSPDRETLCQSARSLAEIGDRRAVPHLLNLIKQSRDNRVIAAASDALAALGELSATHQIIPQMRTAGNRTLKRALALAAGDLLGERETYYKLLITEIEEPGAAAAATLHDLKRNVRKGFPDATRQIETISLIEGAYQEGEIARCAELLLHLGLHLVQFIHRVPLTLDPDRAMQNLLERDRRSAMGIWFLKVLNEPWEMDGRDSREPADILLGIHVVAGFLK
jgi:MFS family permease